MNENSRNMAPPTDPRSTDKVIAALAAQLQPVRRLRSPALRSVTWLGVVLLAAACVILNLADLGAFEQRVLRPRAAVEILATLLTGVIAVVAAFHLSLPDRSRYWALAPVPALAVWIASSGYSCWRHWLIFGDQGWQLGESAECFAFIVGLSLPLSALLLWALRRARPLAPLPVAATGTLGVAGLSAFLLQFFHPFDVTLIDLGLHLAAVLLVVVAGAVFARPVLQDR